jgi:hypothetical protein
VPVEERKKNTLWPHRSLLRQRLRVAYDLKQNLAFLNNRKEVFFLMGGKGEA